MRDCDLPCCDVFLLYSCTCTCTSTVPGGSIKAGEVHNRVGGMSGRGNLQLEQREGSGPGNQHSNSNSDLIDLKVQKAKTTTTTKGLFVKNARDGFGKGTILELGLRISLVWELIFGGTAGTAGFKRCKQCSRMTTHSPTLYVNTFCFLPSFLLGACDPKTAALADHHSQSFCRHDFFAQRCCWNCCHSIAPCLAPHSLSQFVKTLGLVVQ